MRAHYFQHVPFEGLGSIAPRLEARGYSITCTPFTIRVQCPVSKRWISSSSWVVP